MPKLFHGLFVTVLTGLFCCAGISVHAQAPAILWQQSIGGSGQDYGYSVRETFDSGFIVVGTSNSAGLPDYHGGYDVIVVKQSATGSIVWQKMLGGTGDDYGSSIRQTADSGYIIAGSSNSGDGDAGASHGGFDMWVIKLSATGDIEWQATLGGSGDDNGYDVRQTFDSGYIVSGRSASADGIASLNHGGYDYWVVKLSATGGVQWQQSYGGTGDENAVAICQTVDSGYIVAGDSYSADGDISAGRGGEDYWIVKLSAMGDMQWERSLGGAGSDYAQSVVQTADNGYVIAGGSNSANGDITDNIGGGDLWVVKLSATGNIEWQKSLGSTSDDAANSVSLTADGGILVAGWVSANNHDVTGFHGSADYWLVKLSAAGSMQWQKSMGSLGLENAWSAMQTRNGDYIVAGYSSYSGGDVSGNHGNNDMWVVRLGMPPTAISAEELNKGITVYPNPTSGNIEIRGIGVGDISICNLAGVVVKRAYNANHISIADEAAGLYLLRFTNRDGMVLMESKILKQ